MTEILESLSPEPLYGKSQWRKTLNLAGKLSGLIKNYLIDYHSNDFAAEVERIADHHGLEFINGETFSSSSASNQPANLQHAIELLPAALDECKGLSARISWACLQSKTWKTLAWSSNIFVSRNRYTQLDLWLPGCFDRVNGNPDRNPAQYRDWGIGISAYYHSSMPQASRSNGTELISRDTSTGRCSYR